MRLSAKRILVPVSGDEVSERAFRWACHAAREAKAELQAVYVIEVPLDLSLEAEMTEDINRGENILNRIEAIGSMEKCKTVRARYMRARHAGSAIVLETQDRNVDLVVMGIPYRKRFGSCDMGSTAEYIFHNATCEVMLWRDPAVTSVSRRD